MSKFESDKSIWRYTFFSVIFCLVAIAVVFKGAYVMTVERSYWLALDSLRQPKSDTVAAMRGNILAAGGQRLACNLPEYELRMDFQTLKSGKADTLWHDSLGNDAKALNELCEGLHQIFPEKTAEEFKAHLKEGYNQNNRFFPIVKGRVDYTTFQRVKSLPILCLKRGVCGFAPERYMVRNHPYGSLCTSLIGGVQKSTGIATSGIELACDSFLQGKKGFISYKKELNKWITVSDSMAIDGNDVVTTIDVGIQDLAERALEKELRKDHAYTGVAIVMEVATGDIKAMVNLDLDRTTGKYYEGINHAISDYLEPGSVFKTASFLVALDDGKIDTTMTVDCSGGIREMYGAKMRDHNWTSGGYKTPLSVSQIMQKSSNIGVSVLIDRYYHSRPENFVEGLHRLGIADNLGIRLKGYMKPKVRFPERDSYGHWTKNWSDTALPWMSIGYESNVPPISVLTFYNAIANNGVMVRPRFVKHIEKDGEIIQEFPVMVMRESIVKNQKALEQMQKILIDVVSHGLGKPAGSRSFLVAGKTGTAQKASGGSYNNGVTHYLLSFAGYFPADAPRYSCIVCIQKAGLPASGGQMSGQVFHDIAEGIMAKDIYYNAKGAHDVKDYSRIPDVKAGNLLAADYVLSEMGFNVEGGWQGERSDGKPIWGIVNRGRDGVKLRKSKGRSMRQMPDVRGMGARDAVYAIEGRGAKVVLNGRGKVYQQSKPAGRNIKKGEIITLYLS